MVFLAFDTISSNFTMSEVSPEKLKKLLRYAYLSFYLRPAFIIKIISEISSNPKESLNILKFLYIQAKVVLEK